MKVILMFLFVWFLIPVSGQNTEKYINVGTFNVDLHKVNLIKGNLLGIKEDTISGVNGEMIHRIISETILTENKTFSFIYLIDTSFYLKNSNWSNSHVDFFEADGKKTFSKEYIGMAIEECLINRKYIYLKISNEEENENIVFDKLGKELLHIKNERVVSCSNVDNTTILLLYEVVDEGNYVINGFSEFESFKLIFTKTMPIIKNFSNNGKFIVILHDNYINVYDNTGIFYWKIEYEGRSGFFVFDDGKRYLTMDYNKSFLEVRNFITHELCFSISEVKFEDHKLDISNFIVLDNSNDFYIESLFESKRIYNFYNNEGIIINTTYVPISEEEPFARPGFVKRHNVYEIVH